MLPSLENRRPWLPFLVAIPIFVAAAGFRFALFATLGTRIPYVTFFPAVMLAAILGGPYAGFVVAALSTLFTAYYLMEPVGQILVRDFGDCVGIVIFLLSCLMVCWLAELARRARKRASEAEARVELAAERERAGAALAESEAKFRSYMESSPIAVLVVDKDGQYVDFNAATTALLGYPADTFAGMNILDVHPIEDHSAVIRQLSKLFETGRMDMETRLLRADGRPVWVSLHAASLNSGHAIIYCQDITGLKDAVSSMRERLALQEQLATITAVAPGVIHSFRLRPDGSSCFPYASPALETIYGLQPAEVVEDAAAVFALIYPEDRKQVMRSMEESARTLTPWRAEFRVRHPRQGEIWVEGHTMPNKEADESILWQGFLHDITARKRTEEMVLETSRRLELATRSGGIGVWDWNIATGTLHWNDRMFELYGISPHSFDGSVDAWIATVHPDDRALARAAGEAAISGEKDYGIEFRVVQADGRLKTLKSDAVVVRDEKGHPLRLIGLNRDITEQRELAARLLQAQKMEALGRLAGGVAHDFNNNITVILGYTELSRHAEVNGEKFHEYLDEISKAAEHSRDVTQQLLAFSRHEIITPRRVDLNQLIRQTEKTLLPLIGENIQFCLSTPEGIWPVLIDPAQFKQVLINLAANARDAMPAG
ncbi:MAG: PAS domain-containing protein, partial [Verrucomicrobia bacterium]|nr:PAS domain-containing protein [Deltaproteobacteria bacterium]